MDNWVPLTAVVIAQFVLVGLFFARQRAEDERRWHEKRLNAYRDLSKAARMASEVFALAEEPEDLDDRRLVEAVNAADICMLDIDLLSSPRVREAAIGVHTLLELSSRRTAKPSPGTRIYLKRGSGSRGPFAWSWA
jgi:hypothetical protein